MMMIKANPQWMRIESKKQCQQAKELLDTVEELKVIRRELDWQIKSKNDIDQEFGRLIRELEQEGNALLKLGQFMEIATNEFEKCETEIIEMIEAVEGREAYPLQEGIWEKQIKGWSKDEITEWLKETYNQIAPPTTFSGFFDSMDMLFTNTPLDPRTDAKNWRFSAGSIGKASSELLNMMLEARDDIQQKAEQIGDVAYNTAKTGLEYAEKKYWEFEEQVVAKGIGEFQKNILDFSKQWEEDDWVLGVKWSRAVHGICGGSVGKGVYIDPKGNIAIMDNTSLSAESDFEATFSAGIEISDNATTVRDMEGWSVCGGAGGDVFNIAGADYEYSRAFGDNEVTSHSVTVSGGPGISPIDIHGGISQNTLNARVNIVNLEGEYHGGVLGVSCNALFDVKKGYFDVDFGFGDMQLYNRQLRF